MVEMDEDDFNALWENALFISRALRIVPDGQRYKKIMQGVRKCSRELHYTLLKYKTELEEKKNK